MRTATRDLLIYLAVVFVIFSATGVGWIIASHFEAQTYNKATGSELTTWDAMWIELRVQASPQPKQQ